MLAKIFGGKGFKEKRGVHYITEPASDDILTSAKTLFDAKKYDAAIKMLEDKKYLEDARLLLSDCYVGRGNARWKKSGIFSFDDAIADWSAAIGYNPKNAAAHFNLGFASESFGWRDVAENNYRLAFEITPETEKGEHIQKKAADALKRLNPGKLLTVTAADKGDDFGNDFSDAPSEGERVGFVARESRRGAAKGKGF